MSAIGKKVDWREHIPVWRAMEPTPAPDMSVERTPVVIVGTGPVGLALAIDLGMRGHDVILLGRFDFIPAGSKAICFSKRTLDILNRLGVGEEAVARGVVWNVGKVFWQDRAEPVYQFDLLPVKNQQMPAFINLQQYHMEAILLERLKAFPNVQLRWGHDVVGLEADDTSATLRISTQTGDYHIEADWVIACDGNKSTIRDLMNLDFDGRVFEDNFLIADVKMEGGRPSERWFWFDPPFNPGQSVLMHKQPDNVWRLDFQLGWDIDREACIKPENVEPFVKALLGEDVAFEEEWYSVYTFQCRRMKRFVHDRVLFAGDSAHLVSPFGARGCNGGFADADNLGWKLDLILRKQAGVALLESYNDEAIVTADENILNSTRSTDFITPKSTASRAVRDAVLDLASEYEFARGWVNSGRLSTAVSYPQSSLSTADDCEWESGIAPGCPAVDAPLGDDWLLSKLGGSFTLVSNGPVANPPPGVKVVDLAGFADNALALERFDLVAGGAYLVRPDQYVAARWREPTPEKLAAALTRAMGASA